MTSIPNLFQLFLLFCFIWIIVRISTIKDRKNSDVVEEKGSLVVMSTWKKTHDKVFLFFFWWFIVVNALVLIFGIGAIGFLIHKKSRE